MTGLLAPRQTIWSHLPAPNDAALQHIAELEVGVWDAFPVTRGRTLSDRQLKGMVGGHGYNPGRCACVITRLRELIALEAERATAIVD